MSKNLRMKDPTSKGARKSMMVFSERRGQESKLEHQKRVVGMKKIMIAVSRGVRGSKLNRLLVESLNLTPIS